MPGCDERLSDPQWQTVLAETAHIYGLNPTAARYVDAMTDEERNAYENLLILCPTHHTKIDKTEPQSYPAERLLKIKHDHEHRQRKGDWTTETNLQELVRQLAEISGATIEPEAAPFVSPDLSVELEMQRDVYGPMHTDIWGTYQGLFSGDLHRVDVWRTDDRFALIPQIDRFVLGGGQLRDGDDVELVLDDTGHLLTVRPR